MEQEQRDHIGAEWGDDLSFSFQPRTVCVQRFLERTDIYLYEM